MKQEDMNNQLELNRKDALALTQTFSKDWLSNCIRKQLELCKQDLRTQADGGVENPSPLTLTPENAKLAQKAVRAVLAFYLGMAPSNEGTRSKFKAECEAHIATLKSIETGELKVLNAKEAKAKAAELEELQKLQAELLAKAAAIQEALEL